MNSLYIGIGLAVILALVTALLGPLFVDWGTHRAVFEAQASRIVGLPVRVLGDVDARLLPSPRVRFGDVVIGDIGRPVARVGRFELDLDVAALLRGETRVSDLVLDRPGLDLEIDETGTIVGLPTGAADLSQVRIETVRFVDGRARLADRRAGAAWSIERIAGHGAVESLAGAFRLDLSGIVAGRTGTLRLAARRTAEGPRLRFSAAFDGAAVEVTGEAASGGGERPSLSGPIGVTIAAGDGRPTLVGAGQLRLDTDGARLADLSLRFGSDETSPRLTGTAEARFGGAPSLVLALGARRLDLDGGDPATAGGARARLAALRGAAARLLEAGGLPRATRARIDVETIAVAGGLLSEVSAELASRPGGLAVERFAARLPGETDLTLSGRLDVADETLRGRGRLATAAPESLAAWWSGTPAGATAIGAVRVEGPFAVGRDGFVGSELDLALAGAAARGRVELRPDGLSRLGLSADRLDGRRLAALAGRVAASGLGARGLDLDLDVREATLGDLAARGARIALHADPSAVTIDRLVVADLAGARLALSGRIADPGRAPEGRLEGRIAAERPGPAARALLDLVEPRATRLGELVATAAGPLDLTVTLAGGRGGDAATGRLDLTVAGRAGGGDLGLDLRWDGRFDDPLSGRFDGRLAATGARLSETAARLLEAKPQEAVELSGALAGRLAEGVKFDFSAGLGDRRLTLAGDVAAAADGTPSARLAAHVAAPDVGALADLLGRPVAAFEGRTPIDLDATLEGWGATWRVARLAGSLAETRIEGAGQVDLGAARPKIAGRLDLSEGDLATLADMALTAPVDFDLATEIARMTIDEARTATAVAARLGGRGGAVTVDDLTARVGAARLGGALRAQRSGAAIALSGRLDGAIDAVTATGEGGRPALSGRLSGEIGFEARGEDAARLIASASGSGRVRLDDGRLFGFEAARLAAPREAEGSAEAILAAMAGQVAPIAPAEVSVLVEKGVVRAPHVALAPEGARASGRLSADLGTGRLDGVVTLEPVGEDVARRATAISHQTPTLDLRLGGNLAGPRLGRDTATLAAFLALHRVEAEIAAADVRRQDRIERRRFSEILARIEARRQAREAASRPLPTPTPPPGTASPMPPAPAAHEGGGASPTPIAPP